MGKKSKKKRGKIKKGNKYTQFSKVDEMEKRRQSVRI
jgi:hypothetical protein